MATAGDDRVPSEPATRTGPGNRPHTGNGPGAAPQGRDDDRRTLRPGGGRGEAGPLPHEGRHWWAAAGSARCGSPYGPGSRLPLKRVSQEREFS